MEKSLQQEYGAHGICFGCGPLNSHGLKINSYVRGDLVVADWVPQEGHEGFKNMLNGGIMASLFDCHCNWTAAWFLMKKKELDVPLSTVTGNFSISFLAPTSMDDPIHLESRCTEIGENSAKVAAKIYSKKTVTAEFFGTFVAVKPGHPAYGQWKKI